MSKQGIHEFRQSLYVLLTELNVVEATLNTVDDRLSLVGVDDMASDGRGTSDWDRDKFRECQDRAAGGVLRFIRGEHDA